MTFSVEVEAKWSQGCNRIGSFRRCNVMYERPCGGSGGRFDAEKWDCGCVNVSGDGKDVVVWIIYIYD